MSRCNINITILQPNTLRFRGFKWFTQSYPTGAEIQTKMSTLQVQEYCIFIYFIDFQERQMVQVEGSFSTSRQESPTYLTKFSLQKSET